MSTLHTVHTVRANPPPLTITLAQRASALRLAAVAGCDVRTALRALRYGAGAIRTLAIRDRVEKALRELADDATADRVGAR